MLHFIFSDKFKNAFFDINLRHYAYSLERL